MLPKEVEKSVDKLIPYCFILLTIIIILEFTVDVEPIAVYIEIADYFIFVVFFMDLFFKWEHVKDAKTFARLYWIEIIAVFPFYLVFRVFEFLTLGEDIVIAQKAAHELKMARELKELEILKGTNLAEETRFLSVSRIGQSIERFFRVIGTRLNLAHDTMHHVRHHQHSNKKKYSISLPERKRR